MAYLLFILYSVFLSFYLDHRLLEFDDFLEKHYHLHG